jgi:hypothetical protein
MLSRLLVAGVLAGAGVGHLIGQAGAGSVPFDWASLVGGALGSSPAAIVLAWRLNKADKDNTAMRDELRQLHTESRQTAERMATALADSTRALAEAAEGMEATLARRQPPSEDLARQVRRLEQLIRDKDTDRRGGAQR